MATGRIPASVAKAMDAARLAMLCGSVGRYTDSVANFRAAIKLAPPNIEMYRQFSAALLRAGEMMASLLWMQKSYDMEPSARMGSGILFAENGIDYDVEVLAQHHRAWAAEWTGKVKLLPRYGQVRDDKLRVGYVSPDFCKHPVAQFIGPVLKNHDKSKFTIYAYYNGEKMDDTSLRLQGYCDVWRGIWNGTDDAVARLIRDDGIDILVDLAGHTRGNRLLVFARKPAPVQVTYLGYGNTTGMKQMDWRLTDEVTDPKGCDHLYSEKLYRLPGCFLCWQPPADAPDVAVVPADRPMRFGSFNAVHKINEQTIGLWSRVLKAVPSSLLVLKADGFRDDGVRLRYEKMFASQGVPVARLEFWMPPQDYKAHLSLYEHIDVALDTVPYNGTTTTCEAAWMGVPTLTLTGDRHLSRVSTSLNLTIQRSGFIAETEGQFVDRSRYWNEHRVSFRKNMRDRMSESPLCDGVAFTRELEVAYRHIWSAR